MRHVPVVLVGFLLAGCTASVSMGLDGELEHGMRIFAQEKQSSSVVTVLGGEFSGKFATASAINSDRTFGAEYYGSLHIVVRENGKIECDWNVDGRMRDVAYGGVLGASSSVCFGRLQPDGTFGFRGAYIVKEGAAAEAASGAVTQPSFTMEGKVKQDAIEGNLILGDDFAAIQGETDPGVAFFIVPVLP